jgi:hypothetical protein
MEKTGLTHVRTIYPSWRNPLPGSELGEVEYEITRQEWEAKRSAVFVCAAGPSNESGPSDVDN